MRYARNHVQQALSAAREAGRDVTGLAPEKRETAILLEQWGLLPIDQTAHDQKVSDWYVANGLATRPVDPPGDTRGDTPDAATVAAFAAAESALATAQAMLTLARAASGGGGA